MSLLSMILAARKLACLGRTAHQIATDLDCHMLTAIDAKIWAERAGRDGRLQFLRTASNQGEATCAKSPATK